MNKQKFVEHLRNPGEVSEQSLTELEELIQTHPYFQGARTLLAKVSKQLKDKKAGQRVNSAAIYATDRALLKRFINDQLIFLSPLQVHESHEADHERHLSKAIKKSTTPPVVPAPEAPAEKPKPAAKPIKAEAAKQSAPSQQEVKPAPESKEQSSGKVDIPIVSTEPGPPSDLDHIIDELYQDLEELKTNRAKLKEIEDQLAEEEAVSNAVKKATAKAEAKTESKTAKSSEEQKTAKPDDEGAPTKAKPAAKTTSKSKPTASKATKKEEKPAAKKSTTKAKPATASKTKATGKATTEDEKEADAVKKASESRSARTSRTKSTSSGASAKKSTTKKTTTSKSTAAKSTAAKKSTTKAAKSKPATKKSTQKKDDAAKPESKEDKGERPKVDQSSIIENFIKTNPSITPAQAKPPVKNDEDLSGDSTLLHPDIASEYLAEIYLEQGSKDRAIQIYEALIVKFPEKSVYFADVIKNLKKES